MAKNKEPELPAVPPLEEEEGEIDEVLEEAMYALSSQVDDEEVDENGLTKAEREEIEREAEAAVAKEKKERAKKNYKALALAKARHEANLNTEEEKVLIHLDLPAHTDGITINGRKYLHGGTYTVPRSLANFLSEKQQWCWRHEDEIGGANRQFEKARNLRIGSKDLGIPNSVILKG